MHSDSSRLVTAHESLARLAVNFERLHHHELLVLPNAWDAASARVVEAAGFPAVATASAAISAMLGYPDGERTPVDEMFAANARIARAVQLPVSMDAEGGYGLSPAALVSRLLEIGVVGCNLEDTDHRGGGLRDAEKQAQWLSEVRSAADAAGVPLVINARVDVFFSTSDVPEADRIAEAIRRGRLYRSAGATCIYPIGVGAAGTLAALVAAIDSPLNANTTASLDLPGLRALGVARVSYGPRFYRAGLEAFATAVRNL